MKLWHISQEVNDGYDTYSDAVVAAETEQQAREISPGSGKSTTPDYEWAPVKDVKARYIGEAAPGIEAGVICASFHAG